MEMRLFTYPWDLEAEGYDRVIGTLADNGITAVNFATAYHAGKFLLPRNPKHRTYFPEDGSIYFRPDLARYGRIRPRVNSLVGDAGDPVSRLVDAVGRRGVGYVAWVVLMHNTWLGSRYPDVTMHTAFGDPLVHSLNPSHPDVREYVLAMLGDLVSRYDVDAMILESPGYMSYSHGWHHEIHGVALDALQEQLAGISFSPYEIVAASEQGIDVARLKTATADLLDRSWNHGFALLQGDERHPEAENLLSDPGFRAYEAWQRSQVVSLAGAIRATVKSANPRTEIWHLAELDGDRADAALLDTGDGIMTGYASSDANAIARVSAARSDSKKIHGMIRALPPDTVSPEDITRRMNAWRAASIDGVDIYNYGFMPRRNLDELYRAISMGRRG